MKIAVVKNGIRYFRKQLDATENKDKKIYYQWEIDRLEEKLYNTTRRTRKLVDNTILFSYIIITKRLICLVMI